jgi:hypothetical protein
MNRHPDRSEPGFPCHAALDEAGCAPFRKERRMKFTGATKLNIEIRGSVVEGSAVPALD